MRVKPPIWPAGGREPPGGGRPIAQVAVASSVARTCKEAPETSTTQIMSHLSSRASRGGLPRGQRQHSIVNFLIAFYTIHLLLLPPQLPQMLALFSSHESATTTSTFIISSVEAVESSLESNLGPNLEPNPSETWLRLSELAADREEAQLDRLLHSANEGSRQDDDLIKVSESQERNENEAPEQVGAGRQWRPELESRLRGSHKHHRRGRHKSLASSGRQDEDSGAGGSPRARRHFEPISGGGGGYYDPSNSMQAAADRPLVATRKGLIRGVTQKIFTGKFVDAFLGIPFAQPPVGKYRFKHPQAINSWQGELDASRQGNSCYQVNDTFFGATFGGTSIWNANTPLREDCLYLNIWTPFGVANTTTTTGSQSSSGFGSGRATPTKRPVLVWIFGGGFTSGTSTLSLYEGGALASEEDIIVVSMNYRVSALGFLYFGRPDAPGNAGLFDQLMALQWINDNIDQFGGDPNRVTIFGESSGAVSVSYHLLSPLSRNLFQQAILQSGAATCPWGSMEAREIMANGLQLAAQLNCPSNNSDLDAVIECLLKADPMALVSQDVGQTRSVLNFPFVPVVDGSFLLESPRESLQKSNFKQAKLLLGSNHDEGNSFLVYLSEFSHCPKEGEKSSSSQASSKPPSGTSQTTTGNDNGDFGNTEMSGDSSSVVSEFRNSNGERIESFSLMLSSGERQRQSGATQRANQQQQQQQDLAAGGQSGASGGSGSGGGGSTNESTKPCMPNEFMSFTRDDFIRVLHEDLNPFAASPIGKEAIIFEYSNWNNPLDPSSNYDALDKIVGDYYFTCNVNEFAQRYASAGNAVFMYYFKQRSSVSPWPKWMGVLHGDEINFIFGEPLNPAFNYTEKEVELSRRMMRYWANFAKYGNPIKPNEANNSNQSAGEKWPEYADKRQYFELHADYIRLGRGPRAKQCAFWAHYLPELIQSFERSQCSVDGPAQHRYPTSSHPLAYNSDSHLASHSLRAAGSSRLSNFPSPLMLGLFVIIIIIIVGLLVYANKTGKLDLNLGSGGGGGDATSGGGGGNSGADRSSAAN